MNSITRSHVGSVNGLSHVKKITGYLVIVFMVGLLLFQCSSIMMTGEDQGTEMIEIRVVDTQSEKIDIWVLQSNSGYQDFLETAEKFNKVYDIFRFHEARTIEDIEFVSNNQPMIILAHGSERGIYDMEKMIHWEEVTELQHRQSNLNIVSCYSQQLLKYGVTQQLPTFTADIDQVVAFYRILTNLPAVTRSLTAESMSNYFHANVVEDRLIERIVTPESLLSQLEEHPVIAAVTVDQKVKQVITNELSVLIHPSLITDTFIKNYIITKIHNWDNYLYDKFGIYFIVSDVFFYEASYDENNLALNPSFQYYLPDLSPKTNLILSTRSGAYPAYYTVGYDRDNSFDEAIGILENENGGTEWQSRSTEAAASSPSNEYAFAINLIGYARDDPDQVAGNWAYSNYMFMQWNHPWWDQHVTFAHEFLHTLGASHEYAVFPTLNQDAVPDGDGRVFDRIENTNINLNYDPSWNYDPYNWYFNGDTGQVEYSYSIMDYVSALQFSMLEGYEQKLVKRLDWLNSKIVESNKAYFDFFALSQDKDGDGLADPLEGTVGADWELRDTDADGMGDLYEYTYAVQRGGSLLANHPDDQLDYDADGLSNYEESLVWSDPIKVDTDNDGLNDYDEAKVYSTDPVTFDTDGDGLSDYTEAITTTTSPTNPDTDGDGIDDGYEFSYAFLSPNSASDANQDYDGDGLSNLVEYRIGYLPDNTDSDGDGINDIDEDGDGDGLTNAEELNLGTELHKEDTDGDVMPDGYEFDHGLDPLVNDQDGDLDNDGVANYQEYVEGADPNYDEREPTNIQTSGFLNGDYIRTGTITATADDPNGINAVYFYLKQNNQVIYQHTDTSSPFTWSIDSSIADGAYTLKVYAYDPNGNWASSDWNIVVDKTEPNLVSSFSASSTHNGWVSGTLYFDASATDNIGIASLTLTYTDIFGTTQTVTGNPIDLNVNSGLFEQGETSVVISAIDNAGNSDTVVYTVKIDRYSPTGSVYLYGGGSWVTGTSRDFYTSNVYDATSGIDKVEFYVDSTFVGSDSSDPYRKYNLDSRSFSDGTHAMKIKIFDNAGNVGWGEVSFVIDNNGPTASVSGIANGASYDQSTSRLITVSGASDSVSGYYYTQIWVDSSHKTTQYYSDFSYTLSMSSLSTGSHTLYVKLYDYAGNVRTYSRSFSVTGGDDGGGGSPSPPSPPPIIVG